MSFSFNVPGTPAAEFEVAAAKAKADLQAASEGNDYMLTQYASDTCDAAIKAAVELVASFGDDGSVTATISGHHADDATSARTASVSITYTPAPAAPASKS